MEQFSRPAALEDLKLLLRSLNAHGADYFLIDGYALAQKRSRSAVDLGSVALKQTDRFRA
jgi:hypothetical protein